MIEFIVMVHELLQEVTFKSTACPLLEIEHKKLTKDRRYLPIFAHPA